MNTQLCLGFIAAYSERENYEELTFMRVLIILVVFVVMVSIPKRLRMQIIKEHARTNNIAAAARSVGVSYSTAKRWVARSNSA